MVRAGDNVQQGDILLEIEPQDYEIGLKEAQAAYQLAYIQAEQAVSNQTRFETLLEEGAVTKVQVEEIQIGAKLARAQSQRALAGLELEKAVWKKPNSEHHLMELLFPEMLKSER